LPRKAMTDATWRSLSQRYMLVVQKGLGPRGLPKQS